MVREMNFNGAIPSPQDTRDYKIVDLIAGASAPVTEKAYQNQLGWEVPIFDQKTSNECVGCSLAVTRWITEKTQSGNVKPFSPSFIFFNRDREIDYCGEGMIPREALKNLRNDGVCFYDSLPGFYYYDTNWEAMTKKIEQYRSEALPYRISSFYAVSGRNELKNTIKTLGAVSVMLPVYECMYEVGEDGNMPYDSSKNYENLGYHQVTFFGWDETGWLCINSYGESWGFKGRFHVPFEHPIQEAWAIVDEITEVTMPCASSSYTDIKGHWNENLLKHVIDKGIMVGSEQKFRPDDSLTRCEFVTVLYRLGLLGDVKLPDVY